ncbi:DUF6951 family protein [Chloroflexota bacterium]
MTTVEVDGGICGYVSAVRARRSSPSTVHVDVESDCSMVMACTESLNELQARDALNPRREGWVHKLMFKHIRHAGCPVPTGVAKAVEVEMGAALPADAYIRFLEPEGKQLA